MLTNDDIQKIVALARLVAKPDELERLTTDINAILEYVGQLERLDVSEVEPTSHVHGITNVMREDALAPTMLQKDAFQNAPDTSDSFFRVPLIIDSQE